MPDTAATRSYVGSPFRNVRNRNVGCFSLVPDLMAKADVFTDKTSASFSELLFDIGREQVVVGAR